MKRGLSLAFLFCLILSAADLTSETRQKDWYRVFFTSPVQKKSAFTVNPEKALVQVINRAEKKFYGAFFEVSSKPVADALIKAKSRGVDVRIVLDSDYYERPAVTSCIRAGIPIVQDNRRGFMHNKFAVIDKDLVWTGSYNATQSGAWKNNNNAVLIVSERIASFYLDEFMEMFRDKVFANKREKGPLNLFGGERSVLIEGTKCEVYFSPEDMVQDKLVKAVLSARKSIHFMAFSFTSDELGEAMINRFKNGVAVKGIFEKRGANSKYSEYLKMKVEGIPVKLDKNPYVMHHKVIIIDGETVVFGSYNFSKNAGSRNDENIMIIHDKSMADLFMQEFSRLYR